MAGKQLFIPRSEHPLVRRDGKVDTTAWYPWMQALIPQIVDAGVPGDIVVQVIHTHHIGWASAAPTKATWVQGDVIWNTGAAVGQPAGWMCVASGTPGTWAPMGNL